MTETGKLINSSSVDLYILNHLSRLIAEIYSRKVLAGRHCFIMCV